LGALGRENEKKLKKRNIALICSFQNVVWTIAISVLENLAIHFISEFLDGQL